MTVDGVYVDDIILTGSDKHEIQQLKSHLNKTFSGSWKTQFFSWNRDWLLRKWEFYAPEKVYYRKSRE